MPEPTDSEDVEADDEAYGPMKKVPVPQTFQGWCSLISDIIAPAEELSPFKLGQIKELIGEINHSAGLFVAPVFVTLQIIFLLAFVGYLVVAIFALVSDFEAANDACAHESWVWLFSLLAVAIPSGLGLVMGIVKATLKLANLRARFGWEVPPALLSFAAPCSYIALGTLGILLWVNMSASCAASYAASYALLFVIFKIQVIMLGVAAILGGVTTFAQSMVLLGSILDPKDPDFDSLSSRLKEQEQNLTRVDGDYVSESETIIQQLKDALVKTEEERDALQKQRAALKGEEEDSFPIPTTFGEFSAIVVKHLAPVEEISPFKLGQIQELIASVSKEAGDAVAPAFAILIVIFLLAFVAYLTLAVIALVLDQEAAYDVCAQDSWVWLYVLLALAIPTVLGALMGCVKASLNAADLKKNVGWEVPSVFLALPGPITYIVFAVLGILLWVFLDDTCEQWYRQNTGLLFVIFKIQVIMMGVAALFGVLTCIAQGTVLIALISSKVQETMDATDTSPSTDGDAAAVAKESASSTEVAENAGVTSKDKDLYPESKGAQGAEDDVPVFPDDVPVFPDDVPVFPDDVPVFPDDVPVVPAAADGGIPHSAEGEEERAGGEGGYQMPSLPEMPKIELPEMPKIELPEMPKIELPEMPKIELPEMPDIGFTFQDFSAIVVEKLSPIEQLAPFKLGQIQKLIADADEEAGRTTAPFFAIGLVLFLLAFVAYMGFALVALVLDVQAMDDECAEETWVWIYVFLVFSVPTVIGSILALIQSGLQIAFPRPEDAPFMKVADFLLSIPSPLLNATFGILGLLLWGGMEDDCADFYWDEYRLLLVIFYIQIGIMCISGLLGLLVLFAMVIGIVNSATAALRQQVSTEQKIAEQVGNDKQQDKKTS